MVRRGRQCGLRADKKEEDCMIHETSHEKRLLREEEKR